MEVLQLEGSLQSRVLFYLKNSTGDLVLSKQDKNADTIWAKLHAPTGTLYFDLVSKPVTDVLGDNPQQKILTADLKALYLRSYLFENKTFTFSNADNEYTCEFSWENTSLETATFYGLLAYVKDGNTQRLYTLYTFNDPVEVPPGYIFGGTYKIKVTSYTPTVQGVSENSVEYNSNGIIANIPINSVDKETRKYKWSRHATKSSIYLGIDPSDSVNSFVDFSSVQCDNVDNKISVGSAFLGELYYKALTGGGSTSAKVYRFLQLYDKRGVPISESDLFYIEIDDFGDTDSFSDASVERRTVTVLCSMKKVDKIAVYPWKFGFFIEDIDEFLTYLANNTNAWYDNVMCCAPRFFSIHPPQGTDVCYYYAYWYWSDSPELKIIVPFERLDGEGHPIAHSYLELTNVYIHNPPTFDVEEYGVTVEEKGVVHVAHEHIAYRDIDLYAGWYVYTVDTGSLPSSEGIVILRFVDHRQRYTLKDYGGDVRGHMHTALRWFIVAGDFYGYMVPYTGFFAEGSSDINSNWISPYFVNYRGYDVAAFNSFDYSDSNVTDKLHDIALVQSTPLDQLRNKVGTEYCNWVWVRYSEKDKLAGYIADNTVTHLAWDHFCWTESISDAFTSCVVHSVTVPQLFGEESNSFCFPTVCNCHTRLSNSDGDFNSMIPHTGIYSLLLGQSRDCPDFYIDYTTRTFHIKSGRFFTYANLSFDSNYISNDVLRAPEPLLVVRKQGDESYEYTVPASQVNYTEGTSVVTWGNESFEVETTLESSEKIFDLTFNFSDDTVFVAGEYFSVPINDTCSVLITDKLEKWRVTTVDDLQVTDVTFAPSVGCMGFDRIASSDNLADYAEIVEPVSIQCRTPANSVTFAENTTHYFAYSITVLPTSVASDNFRYVLLLPKKFEIGGETFYTNCESFIVTDGMRVISSSLMTDSEVLNFKDKIDFSTLQDYWVISLNNHSLEELFMSGDPRLSEPIVVPLFVYVEAKKKEDILPIDITLYTNYLRPFGRNDTFTRVYIIEKEDRSVNVYRYPTYIDFHNIGIDSSDNNSMTLDGVSAYMEIKGVSKGTSVDYKEYILPSMWFGLNAWSIDFYFKPFEQPVSGETQILFDARTKSGNNVTGLVVAIRENGCVQVAYPSGRNVTDSSVVGDRHYAEDDIKIQSPKIQFGVWHYMVINCDKGIFTVFLDGKCIGSFVVPYNHTMSSAVIGTRYDKSECFFHGNIRWFHLSWVIRWFNEHTPPPVSSDWDHVEEWGDVAVPAGDAVFKVVLPYALDDKLDVVDENGQHVDFALLTNVYTDASDDNLGNYLYIKCPEIKYSSGLEYVGYSQFPLQLYRYRINSFMHTTSRAIMRVTDSSLSIKDIFGRGIATTCYLQHGWMLRNDFDLMDINFDHCPYDISPANEPILKLPKPVEYRFKVISTSEVKKTPADNFFPLYFKPSEDSVYSEGVYIQGEDWRTDVATKVTSYGVVWNPNEFYNTVEFIGLDCQIKCAVKTATDTNTTPVKCRKLKWYMSSCGLYTTDEGIPTAVSVFPGGSVTPQLFVRGVISYVVGYRNLLSATNTYQFLSSGAANCIDDLSSEVYYQVNLPSDATPHTVTPHVKVYPITASDASRDIAVWEVEGEEGKLITYNVTAFQPLISCYSNWLGTFPLSVHKNYISYSVLFTSHTTGVEGYTPHYIFTQDPDLVTAFKVGTIEFPGLKVGYVDDTSSSKLEPSTEFRLNPTNTLAIKIHAVANSYAVSTLIPVSPVTNPTKGYTVWNSSDRLREHFTDPKRRMSTVYPLMTHVWVPSSSHAKVCTRGYAERYAWDGETVLTELQMHPSFYYMDLNTILTTDTCLKLEFTPGDVTPSSQRLQKGGQIGDYASYCDARILGSINILYNLLWDPQEHPVSKVDSFGHYSVVGASTVPELLIFPVLKLRNTTTSEVKYFMIDRHRFIPKEVPQSYLSEEELEKSTFRDFLRSYYATSTSFVPFDSLISEYSSGEWNFQYGWLFIAYLDNTFEGHVVIRSISVMPSFNDISEYHGVPYCYYNSKVKLFRNNPEDLVPTTDYSVKVYNTADNSQVNIPVRIDLSEINLDNYTQGIVAYLGSTALPTVYELEEGYLTVDWDEFKQKGSGRIYVKIPSIDAKQVLELTLNNVVNTFSISDVFEYYCEFGEGTPDSDWEFVKEATGYTGEVQDVDAGVGMTSTSDRLVGIASIEFSAKENSTVCRSDGVVFVKWKEQFDPTKLYELCYSMDDGVFSAIYLQSSTPSLDEDIIEVPYYIHADDDGVGTVAIVLPEFGQSYTLYVYYDTGSSNSDYDEVYVNRIYPAGIHHVGDIISDIYYEVQTGNFDVEGNVYDHRVVIHLTVERFSEGDRLVLLPIQKWTGTTNFKVFRKKTAADYFSDAQIIVDLRSKFVASKLESPVVVEENPTSRYCGIGLNNSTCNVLYHSTQPYGAYCKYWYVGSGDPSEGLHKTGLLDIDKEFFFIAKDKVIAYAPAVCSFARAPLYISNCRYGLPNQDRFYCSYLVAHWQNVSHTVFCSESGFPCRPSAVFKDTIVKYSVWQLFSALAAVNYYASDSRVYYHTTQSGGWHTASRARQQVSGSTYALQYLPYIFYSKIEAPRYYPHASRNSMIFYSRTVGRVVSAGFSVVKDTQSNTIAAFRLTQTHNSDYIFPAPELESPILGLNVKDTGTFIRYLPTDVTNWVVDEWMKRYDDIKLTTTPVYLHIAISTGRRKSFTLKWFRVSNMPSAPIVQLMRNDLKTLIPNIHSTWYAFVSGEQSTVDTSYIQNHISEVKKRNRSLEIYTVQPLLSAVTECRAIGATWLPPRYTVTHPLFWMNT